ncbi:biotin carboxylase N-terminal domain-containing protein [Solibacillus sp. FSL W8-0474]|uniref:acetyl-CoA carboxylase biotin carboxylase subunit n=1 Tax=Solibacillus sp. FSL W8-0474 TaxID=2975336 RepID=UPI0030FBC3BA
MFKKIMILNRGAIAVRILRTLKEMNINSLVVYSTADKDLPYVKEADEAVELEGNTAQETYLNQDKIIGIIKEFKVDAVHPGYGFLAENTSFARKLDEIGVKFIGPSTKLIDLMADKNRARNTMAQYSMPIGAGSDRLPDDEEEVKRIANGIGYPVLIKPCNGGGGIGMIPVYKEEKLLKSIQKAKSMAEKFFSDDGIYLESYLENPRHIEIQILGDLEGNVVNLFERDCSIQRRHQKIIEESPAPNIERAELNDVLEKVTASIQELGYDNVGTVELLRGSNGNYSFLEINTRLQVEHAVTEEIVDIDLVKSQILSAAGASLVTILPDEITQRNHAIEVRIYAEDPVTFYPSPGVLEVFELPDEEGIRVETGFTKGNKITPYYDPMIAKIIVKALDRTQAINQLIAYLQKVKIEGLKTNVPFLLFALNSSQFRAGNVTTKLTDELVEQFKNELIKH